MVSLGHSDLKLLLSVEWLVGDCVYVHQDYMLWCQSQELFQCKDTKLTSTGISITKILTTLMLAMDTRWNMPLCDVAH